MNSKYLAEEHLKGFEKYKYSSVDTSPISNYVMHPFWNQTVKLVPRWVAPNLLTFTGFLFTILNTYLLSHYDYYFYASSDKYPDYKPVPKWVWLLCAFGHFMAHTLDGIDGKQARRTGSSGPLGELFDHGVDSWTSVLIPICIYSLFGRSDYSLEPFRMLMTTWTIFLTFYISHWEKYNTGILYLPWSYDVTQITLLVMFLVTYVHGHTYWKFILPPYQLTSGQLLEIVSHFGSFGLSVPVTLYNVYVSYSSNSLKKKSVGEAFRPLVPFAILFVSTTSWAYFSPNRVLEKDPRMFIFMTGTVFSHIACRLIVSQMSSTRCEAFNWLLWPLSSAVLGVFTLEAVRKQEMQLLRLITAFVTIAHIHYGVCVVRQMCHHFRINCFSLVKRPGHEKGPLGRSKATR
ncbi:Ethanolaminephosphotransferase 1 [Halotydeus destructor]|nr:Ethanolaminephosphotransferase 1 [Halotydeus destructor]